VGFDEEDDFDVVVAVAVALVEEIPLTMALNVAVKTSFSAVECSGGGRLGRSTG